MHNCITLCKILAVCKKFTLCGHSMRLPDEKIDLLPASNLKRLHIL